MMSVIGHEEVIRDLEQIVSQKREGHAYLFSRKVWYREKDGCHGVYKKHDVLSARKRESMWCV